MSLFEQQQQSGMTIRAFCQKQDLKRCPHRSDVIYYRINQGIVEIMAIIGGQDIDVWL